LYTDNEELIKNIINKGYFVENLKKGYNIYHNTGTVEKLLNINYE
jgi:hypothetical protein